MTAIERTAYPRLKSRYIPKELDAIFTPTPMDVTFVAQATKDDEDTTLRLSCLVQLKCFQYLGYFPTLPHIPEVILRHIRDAIAESDRKVGYRSNRTRSRHRSAIRRYLGVTQYKRGGEGIAAHAILKAGTKCGFSPLKRRNL